MTKEITTTEQRVPAWRKPLDNNMQAFQDALPDHISPEKFKRIAASAIVQVPNLKRLMETNPAPVLQALLRCANDGLLPDSREAALVPFKGSLTYIPMIGGVLKRMRQSGEVADIVAEIVYENDEFIWELGDTPRIDHTPAPINVEPGKPMAAYCVVQMKDGTIHREVMRRSDIMKVKASARSNNGPWAGPFELEMWRKTIIKRAAKYLPLSSDLATMLARDNDYYDPSKAEPKRTLAERLSAEPVSVEESPTLLDAPEVEVEISQEEPASTSVDPTAATQAAQAVLLGMKKAKSYEAANDLYMDLRATDEWEALDDETQEKLTDALKILSE